ncbi:MULTISPECIES: hypothetical protein [Parabacteroides]|nr:MULTISPECIES: hypothetical protein [Parabacteroides]
MSNSANGFVPPPVSLRNLRVLGSLGGNSCGLGWICLSLGR